ARPEEIHGRRERDLQRIELGIDRDPQSLEYACRGMDPTPASRRSGSDPLDERGEILGSRNGRGAPRLDDRPGYPACLGLLAIPPKERRQLICVEGRQELGGGHAPAAIEPHVERAAGPDSEPATRIAQLVTRQAEVEEEAVDRPEARVRRDRAELAKVRLAEDETVAEPGEPPTNPGDGRPISIETEEAAIRIGRLQHPLGVPTATDGGIDLEAAGSWREHRNDLLRQHRQVPFLHVDLHRRQRIPSGPWKRMW